MTSATALTLDTPAQTTPNTAVTLTGTYQGNPQSLDYNFGTGWLQASSVNFSNGIFSFVVPGGIAAGSYIPQVRDHTTPSVSGTAGTFVVSGWTPSTLATSPGAAAVFEFNANAPSATMLAANGTVQSVQNSLDPNQFLTAEVATGGNGIVIANNSGADGARRLLQFHATALNPGTYDPSTNWLGAGGVNGSAGSALVDLANSPNVSTSGSFTAVIALDISKSYTYAAGPIWGTLATPGPLQYAQIRYNGSAGVAGGQLYDSTLSNGTVVGASAQGTIGAGWHVMTMIKNGSTITYRLDGQVVSTAQLTTTLPFTAADFMIGGGFPSASSASASQENGVPPPYVGEFQAYSGVLAGSDLANAEKLAGNAIGLSLTPSGSTPVATITLSAPGTVQEKSAGAGVDITETISTTNLSGSVYEEVLTPSGGVETAYQAIALTNGVGSSKVHLATSGDKIQVVDSLTAPTVTAVSTPVTITDPTVTSPTQTISVSSPGTVQETSVGVGVTVPLTVITTNLSGDIYYEVLTAGGVAETNYTVALPAGAAITVPTIQQQKSGQTFSVQVAFNYIPIRANLKYSSSSGGVTFTTFASNAGITWDSTGQIATIPISNGTAAPHYFQVEDTTTSSPLQSATITYQIGSAGGGGTVTVPPPPTVGLTQTFVISAHLAQSGDTVRVANAASSPTVTGNSSPVTITDPTTTSPSQTISVSSPGTVQEPSAGAGVTVPLTVTTSNLPGEIYYEVLTAAGSQETTYATALPNGAAITVPTIPQQKSGQTFSVQVAFNYVPIHANLQYSSSSGGVIFTTFASNAGITWNATGQVATIPISNGTAAPHYFQVEDTTTATALKSATVTYQIGTSGGGGTVTVAAPAPVGATQTFTISPHLLHGGDVVKVANNPTSPTVTATSAPVTITDGAGTSLTLDTPAQATPNSAITFTGTYQGSPTSLDYNLGAGWTEASSVTFSGGIFTFTVPSGTAAGSYTPQVRDHNATSVVGTAGTFVVSAWAPSTLTTSPGASAVFEFNANDPKIAALGSSATVQTVKNSLNSSQSLTAEVASGGNGIVIANGSGADGTRRLLQFHATKINASIYDPSTDWLGAGGVGGSAGAALVDLANSSNLSTNGSFTTIIALDINKSYDYAAGPIWGSLAVPGPLEYAQIRYNGSSGVAGAEIFDSSQVGAVAQSTISAGWHVMTMIKNGNTITYRLDGVQVTTAHITSTLPFKANDFLIGGGFPPSTSASAGQENGVPPDYIGEFQAYSGVLGGTDLVNAEKLAGNSIGLSLTPTTPATAAVVSAATIQQQSQTPQTASFVAPTTSASAAAANTVIVNQPVGLAAAVQTITGTESDPSHSIFLDWRTTGTPTLAATDWVQATVDPSGHYAASINIDHPGVQSTMFYRVDSGSAVAAWSATPSTQAA